MGKDDNAIVVKNMKEAERLFKEASILLDELDIKKKLDKVHQIKIALEKFRDKKKMEAATDGKANQV